jgi:hypothetical protein
MRSSFFFKQIAKRKPDTASGFVALVAQRSCSAIHSAIAFSSAAPRCFRFNSPSADLDRCATYESRGLGIEVGRNRYLHIHARMKKETARESEIYFEQIMSRIRCVFRLKG